MSTTATSRPPAAHMRRSPPAVSGPGAPPASSLPRGATARAAASARLSTAGTPAARRASLKGAVQPTPTLNGGSRESLAASLKQETEEKEKLMVQVQDKDQIIASLKSENNNLQSALHAAETRVSELYADQGRMEEDLAARIEVIDKLRNQVRELEREKRDTQRRYNEQTATFEAERQAFYDNEQHLKSRIQSLTQARKQPVNPVPPSPSVISVVDSVAETEADASEALTPVQQDVTDPEEEPAEMTALKLELSTLSTSHASLQSTLVLLQTQLNDLKRVNNELQEENESYNILLRERTLNGQFDVLRMGGASPEQSSDGTDEGDENGRDADSLRSRDTRRSGTLDPVHELAEEHEEPEEPEQEQETPPELDPTFGQVEDKEPETPADDSFPRNPRRGHSRRRSSVTAPRGESLANLPITGPGLDLAAELGRAENKDMLEGQGHTSLQENVSTHPKNRKKTDRKVSSVSEPGAEPNANALNDIDALRNEVKSLKDANKALSLYASKIIDRIISQEGFEHVLAVDYEKSPTPSTATFSPPPPATKKQRPQTMMFSRSTPSTTNTTPVIPPPERLTTFESIAAANSPTTSPPKAPASARASRRSLSFDWSSFSMFGGDKKASTPPAAANLRPLTLKAGTPVVTSARKLETQEDEEDRRERERLNATMKLMGIEKPLSSAPVPGSPFPPMLKSYSDTPVSASATTPVAPTPTSRFSFFRRSSSANATSEASSANSSQPNTRSSSTSPYLAQDLTPEVLAQAEAENTLAALDAHERQLSAEIAKGSGGGFTEIVRRNGERRSSRRSGSGSTVWSAGMSKHEDED